jgi:mono/diheme cytochrome c family protein
VAGAPSHGPGGHTWHHADTQIADIILGRAEYPGRTMPSFAGRLSEAEVEALLAHLKGGWTGEQRTAQAEVTRQWEAQQRR